MALHRLHLIENSEAWRPHMRSKARLRTAQVKYFVDPSIGLSALGVGSDELLFGHEFPRPTFRSSRNPRSENLCATPRRNN